MSAEEWSVVGWHDGKRGTVRAHWYRLRQWPFAQSACGRHHWTFADGKVPAGFSDAPAPHMHECLPCLAAYREYRERMS